MTQSNHRDLKTSKNVTVSEPDGGHLARHTRAAHNISREKMLHNLISAERAPPLHVHINEGLKETANRRRQKHEK